MVGSQSSFGSCFIAQSIAHPWKKRNQPRNGEALGWLLVIWLLREIGSPGHVRRKVREVTTRVPQYGTL